MALALRPGTRLYSAVCSSELIVVKAPADEVELTIGGAPALTATGRSDGSAVADGHGGGTSMGKRYIDESGRLELLCTKPGEGLPAVGGRPLALKTATPLPASD